MPKLVLRFLGPPRIELRSAPVRISRRKEIALLAYLAVTAQPHSRDELSEIFSAGEDRAHARSGLRQTLSLLGSAIGEEFLSADRHSVAIVPGPDLWIDVDVFRGLCQRGNTASRRGDLPAAEERLSQATGIWQGDFLYGFYLSHSPAFETWQLAQQDDLRREQASALQKLVEMEQAEGGLEAAIDYGRQWLALDPMEETAHRALMRLLGRAGRRGEALRQYEACRGILENELGQKPGPETEAIREQLVSAGRRAPMEEIGRRALPAAAARLFLFVWGGSKDRRRKPAGLEAGTACSKKGDLRSFVFHSAGAATRAAMAMRAGARGRDSRFALLGGTESARQGPTPILMELAETILDASSDGQVLLDERAARFISDARPAEGAAIRRLGMFRLKDLGPARALYQLEPGRAPRQFSPLKTLDSRPNNLPIQPWRFIGRESELRAVQEALRQEETRLLTLTGAGGTGKTRLALQAAASLVERFQDGVFLVDLGAVREPAQVAAAVAAVLDIREVGSEGRPLQETLFACLKSRQLLLLLDNFEHLLPASSLVVRLLADCPTVKVLATSREALHVLCERVLLVQTMAIPAAGQGTEALLRCETVRLFAERAAAATPDFVLTEENLESVAEICRRVDGLPLAIELAAARIRSLPAKALLERLDSRLEVLTGGSQDLPPRQQTLRTEIDWSHELLDTGGRKLFRRLAIFPGGCTVDAAQYVCQRGDGESEAAEGLASLAEKSLVSAVDAAGKPRFRMLETVREYAREKLVDSGECADVEERFGRFYLRLAELAEPELYGPRQEQWFARLDAECDNLRSALVRMRDAGEWQDGLRLAGALGWYWFRKARFSEGLEWLELFRRAVGPSDPTGPRARAAYYLGWMKLCAGSVFWGNPEGKKLFRESLALWRVEGNKSGIARSQVWLGWKEGVEQAAEWSLADESVSTARDSGDPWALALCLKVAYSHLRRPDRNLASRRAALEEAIVLARTSGDQFLLCQAYGGMGNVFAWIGELRQAEPWYREALRIAHAIDDAWSVLDVTNCLADAYLGLGEVTRAKPLFLLGLRKCVELGARAYVPWFVHGLREVAAKEGRVKRAARLWAVEYSVLDPRAEFDPRICRELNLERGAAEAEWSRGKLLSFDEAVRYACSDR